MFVYRRWKTTFGVVAALLVMASSVAAQSADATLQGVVTDPQKAVLPGVSVTASNVDTGLSRTVVTDGNGLYRILPLPPGQYQLDVELSGFAYFHRTGLILTIGQLATVDVTLQLGNVSEVVTVSAGTPLVDVATAKLGTVVSHNELDSLPVLNRDFSSLMVLSPGVAAVGNSGSIDGQAASSNGYLLDGVNNTAPNLGGPRGSVTLESVREFQVLANQFSAEYGQAAGGVISAVTRSGTNRFEGRVFLFDTDQHLVASNPLATTGSTPFQQQRYGGFFGGPIIKDRMQFFASEESSHTINTSVITAAAVPVDQRQVPQPSNEHQPFVRLDAQLNGKQSLWVRYRLDRNRQIGLGIGGLNTQERGNNNFLSNQDVTANHSTIVTSRLLNEARFSGGYRHLVVDTEGWAPDQLHAGPAINTPNGNFGRASNGSQETKAPSYIFTDNVTYSIREHSFKFGAEAQLYRGYLDSPINGNGTFTFTSTLPFDPNNPRTYPTQFTKNIIPDYPTARTYLPDEKYVLFMQDNWRVGHGVTVNAGLRWDRDNAWKDVANLAIDQGGSLQPRLGVAWDPFGDGKTVVRGGYGLYVDQLLLNPSLTVLRGEIWQSIIISNPGYPDPSSRPGSFVAPNQTSVATDVETPRTRTATLGIKREIGRGLAISIDGTYTRGSNEFYSLDLNAPVRGVRPNSQYAQIAQITTGAETSDTSILVGLNSRRGRIQYGASYTWSDAQSESDGTGTFPQDGVNIAAEKAPATNVPAHQFVGNVTVPMWLGIQASAILQARSGLRWNITTGLNNFGTSILNVRPDLANPNGDPTKATTYFTGFTGRVGNLPRNFGIGPAYGELDLRLSKFVQVGRNRFECLVEAFNVTNRLNLSTPNGNLQSSSFGTSNSIVGNMRQIQVAVRFDFPGAVK